ncbi:MAG: acyl-ACP--UDP-N-acetylglucosamine O-acyltransferase [Verrucomicrobiota bacterium]|jgi:UDP-N-acetylglucosamine acyltransferase
MHHPTAIIHPKASIGSDVTIGPFAIIEEDTEIGDGCSIAAHAQILRGSCLGPRNTIDRAAIIGGNPQSLSFNPKTPSGVRIGEGNTIREHVTIHRSMYENGVTTVGSHSFLMASGHLGHDASLGDHSVVANAALVAGHVTIGHHCFLGGGSVYHQFIRVGSYAMVQGNGSFSRDIPPFCTAFRENLVAGLNVVGLRRNGFDREARAALKSAYSTVFRDPAGPVKAAAAALMAAPWTPAAREFLEFIAASGSRGIAGPRD